MKYMVHIKHVEHADVLVEASSVEEAETLAHHYECNVGACEWYGDEEHYKTTATESDEKPDMTPEMYKKYMERCS